MDNNNLLDSIGAVRSAELPLHIKRCLENSKAPTDPVAAARRSLARDIPAGFQSPNRPVHPAAVLVPILLAEDTPRVLLTRRAVALEAHAGQVSFPGGRVEAGDRDAVETALRETQEETGMPPRQAEIVGYLDPYLTITGYAITPVVALINPDFTLRPDPHEVAEIFDVPLPYLLDPANLMIRSRRLGTEQVRYYVFEYAGHEIWGATARMLVNLADKLGFTGPRIE